MLVYLNGVDDIDTLGRIKWRIPTPPVVKQIITTTKKLVPPVVTNVVTKIENSVKTAAQTIVDKAKEQARKIGAGVQRLASIPQSFVNKASLRLIERNFNSYATRIAEGYRVDPNGLKAIVAANKMNWNEFKAAVNKGTNRSAIAADQIPDYQGDCRCPGNTWGKECCKKKGSTNRSTASRTSAAMYGDNQPTAEQYEGWTKAAIGFIKQLVEWFKKHGKKNQKDDQVIEQMSAEVDADPTIPKFDENGTLLPNADGSYPPEEKKSSIAPVLGLAAAGIAAKALLFS